MNRLYLSVTELPAEEGEYPETCIYISICMHSVQQPQRSRVAALMRLATTQRIDETVILAALYIYVHSVKPNKGEVSPRDLALCKERCDKYISAKTTTSRLIRIEERKNSLNLFIFEKRRRLLQAFIGLLQSNKVYIAL